MIRNLLYSISLHLFLILVLYSNTILYKSQKSLDINTDYSREMNEEELAKIKKNLSGKSKLSGLTLKQKVDLYENYDKIKSIKAVDYEKIKSNLKRNKVFHNSGKKVATAGSVNNGVANNVENSAKTSSYNTVEKDSYKLYVAESDLTAKQIEMIKKQNEIKNEIRKNIKDSDNKSSTKKLPEKIDLNELLKSLDGDLTVVNDKNDKNYEVVDNGSYTDGLDELSGIMDIDNIDELMKIKDNISDDDITNIFTKEDYEKLSNKTNSIYELSFREKNNIQRQIRQCYKNAVLKTQTKSSLVMSAKISLSKNGQIDMNNVIFNVVNEDGVDLKDKNAYFTTVENIKLALVYCNPLRGLPAFKYNIWKNMNLTFNNN